MLHINFFIQSGLQYHTHRISKNFAVYDTDTKVIKTQISVDKTARTFPTKRNATLLEYNCTHEMDEKHTMSLSETIKEEAVLTHKALPV